MLGFLFGGKPRKTKAQRLAAKKRKLQSAKKLLRANGQVVMTKRSLSKAKKNSYRAGSRKRRRY